MSAADADNAPRRNAPAASERADIFRLKLDGATPILQPNSDDQRLVSSNLSVGVDQLLQYDASWSLRPGNISALEDLDAASPRPPLRLAGQRMGQNIRLLLPEIAGSPLALAVSSEFENNWITTGSTQLRRERADVSWSPGPAIVNVQWSGTAPAIDPTAALSCDVQSSLSLPTHEGPNHKEALRVLGRDCTVAADGTPYAGIEAQTWGLSYVWSRPARQSEAALSMIDPVWTRGAEFSDVGPGYELGLSHRRDFGSMSAKALVSMRQASGWEYDPASIDPAGSQISADATDWAANVSLTWRLQDALLSANWAKGVDRLWFTPDPGRRGDQFGLALNLSRWIETIVPGSSPQLAMNWNWSQFRLPDNEVRGSNSMRLDFALMF